MGGLPVVELPQLLGTVQVGLDVEGQKGRVVVNGPCSQQLPQLQSQSLGLLDPVSKNNQQVVKQFGSLPRSQKGKKFFEDGVNDVSLFAC